MVVIRACSVMTTVCMCPPTSSASLTNDGVYFLFGVRICDRGPCRGLFAYVKVTKSVGQSTAVLSSS